MKTALKYLREKKPYVSSSYIVGKKESGDCSLYTISGKLVGIHDDNGIYLNTVHAAQFGITGEYYNSEWIKLPDKEPIGCAIGQRLFYAFTGHGLTAQQIDDILYPELHAIAADLEKGDWIEFPDGTTATITFKPQKRS